MARWGRMGHAAGVYNRGVATLRETLNRVRWAGAKAGRVVIDLRVRRGKDERIEEVDFASVTEILPGGVAVADGTFLPYHRVVAVRRGEEVLWRRGGG
jgi:uncharacterized protein (UPF0248 family)